MAWLFALIGGSATIKPRFMRSLFVGYRFEGPGLGEPPQSLAPFLLRMSRADLAPEAFSVRLGFITKHYIVDLLMKDSFQKGFNDKYVYSCIV